MSFDADTFIDVVLAGSPLNSSAWFCLNPQELLAFAPQEGDNVRLPGVDGLLPRRKFDTELSVDLQFVVTGNVESDGTPISDAAAGLASNKREFAATFFRATRDANGCVVCTVTDVDGAEYEGDVQLGPPVFGEGLFECNAVMTVTIPRGELLAAGS